MRRWKYVALVVVVFSAVTICRADRFVSTSGLHQNGYTNWTDAATNVQDAIDAVAAGETIWVTNGTYVCSTPVSVSSDGNSSDCMISLTKTVTLRSVNGREVTTLDANGSAGSERHVIFFHTGGSPTVRGFTITGGYIASGAFPHNLGGGVLRRAGSPTVTDCVITSNHCASSGSAIYAFYGGTYSDCLIEYNTGSKAVWLRDGGSLLRSTVRANPVGGVMLQNANGPPTAQDCIIEGNGTYGTSGTAGSGVELNGSAGIIRNCVIRDNVGRRGVGVYCLNNAGLTKQIQNCTIVGNSAAQYGAGIYLLNTCKVNIENTIVQGNTAGSYAPEILDNGAIVSASYTYSPFDFSTYGGPGNIVGSNPEFVNAAADYYQLKLSSPCKDKGTNSIWITAATLDIEGNPRIRGDRVDIGAYEESTPNGTVVQVR